MQNSLPEQEAPGFTRVALAIEYDGSHFSGWQAQSDPALPTVQAAVEKAVSKVADHPVRLFCAGRTDAGVHATAQIAHFDCHIDRGIKAWTKGCNSLLPKAIRIAWAQAVPTEFHARFSALHRRYHYCVLTSKVASAVLHGKLSHFPYDLDVAAMDAAAQHLIGEKDFSAFRAAGCQSNTPNRNVHFANWRRNGELLQFDIQANAFLQHMVRNIVGSLLLVGRGQQQPAWIAELLALGDRTLAAATAPPDGLYLVQVGYPDVYQLPRGSPLPPFMIT